jgi:hypothetical protein
LVSGRRTLKYGCESLFIRLHRFLLSTDFIYLLIAAGYVELKDVFRLGAICAIWNVLVWSVVGGIWWKVIGLY